MEKYDYKSAIIDDIKEYLKENSISAEGAIQDKIYQDMELTITGNANGSYYCSAWKAEEALCHNLDLLENALDYFEIKPKLSNPEGLDVLIRTYLFGTCLYTVLLEEKHE